MSLKRSQVAWLVVLTIVIVAVYSNIFIGFGSNFIQPPQSVIKVLASDIDPKGMHKILVTLIVINSAENVRTVDISIESLGILGEVLASGSQTIPNMMPGQKTELTYILDGINILVKHDTLRIKIVDRIVYKS